MHDMSSRSPRQPGPTAVLRVRSGVHRDAVVALRPGPWRVGSSLDDDIVLRDVGVQPGHLVLDVSATTVVLRAAAEGWSLDGAPIAPGIPSTAAADRRAESFALDFGDARIEVVWTAALRRAVGARSRLPSLRMAWSGAAAAIVAGTVALTLSWHDGQRSATRPAAVDPLNGLERRLGASGEWKRVTLVHHEGAGGAERAELRGRVERRDDLERLLRTPEVAAVAPVVRVIVEQELLRQVRDAVADPGLSVSIEDAAPAGRDGAEPGAAAVQSLRVVVSGATRRTGVPAALKLLNVELGERVEIVDRTLYAPDERDRKTVRVELPIRIASVNASERYIESTDGAKYFEGSVVSGYTVESIEARKVVFNVAGRRIEYPVP